MILALSIFSLLLACLPLLMFLNNVPLFALNSLDRTDEGETFGSVSVLIPARDEEASIEASVRAALASQDVELEVIVLDDHSTDRTADIVNGIGQSDSRVRLLTSQALPEGWNGKQFA